MRKPPMVPPGLTVLVMKLKNGFRLRPVLEPHEKGTTSVPRRPMLDLRRRELAALRRDAAISLLLEAPAECSERTRWQRDQRDMGDRRDWTGLEADQDEPPACGRCWTCRVDKFLRDAGVRR